MNPIYFLGWCIFRFLYTFYFGWRVYNAERVPLKGPVILASNHASILDPPLVGAGIRRGINYLARESLFRFPVVGWVLRNWNSVPVDRDGGGAAGFWGNLKWVLGGGGNIFFSERTRAKNGGLQTAPAGNGRNRNKEKKPGVSVLVFWGVEGFWAHVC